MLVMFLVRNCHLHQSDQSFIFHPQRKGQEFDLSSLQGDWWYSAPFTLKKVIASRRSSKFFPRGMQRGGPEDFWQCLRPDLGGKFGSTSLSWLTSSVVEFHQYP